MTTLTVLQNGNAVDLSQVTVTSQDFFTSETNERRGRSDALIVTAFAPAFRKDGTSYPCVISVLHCAAPLKGIRRESIRAQLITAVELRVQGLSS